jgi:Rrf2 family iron-sulfur cluster assembly transcriptional regulator
MKFNKCQIYQWVSNRTLIVLFGTCFAAEKPTLMLQLTMTGEYAVRAMIHLAALPPDVTAQIDDISREWDVPETFLRKIMSQLSRNGLVVTYRGNGGGVELARPAHTITLLEVIESMEGTLALNACIADPNMCHRVPGCAVHQVWCEAQQKLREILSSRTLADLAGQTQQGCPPHLPIGGPIPS